MQTFDLVNVVNKEADQIAPRFNFAPGKDDHAPLPPVARQR